ncbi:probable E3 ubiquitin-protein ligase HECTD4 isoform X2 [Eurytemora carolleeae]|uniref:probable E3 ubiquitin-protein ligase HECTD4 isoform X2 n=1 Tax=Eurytemora carolleeae TaxID=1294199 RepID=UPI000C761753|nr:probable E3 ubiquitin-protein ligase HECTD4 isoform X2 [Eurytemora carolleeae]|eukprot:XP_023341129.1 probable E3 ubiquitin-protein ligase HECTD4 isoform X2 [Eurytemora affinis]
MSWLDESETDELCRRIQLFARNETSSFKTLIQYRTSALTQLWRAKQKWRELEKSCSAEETTGRKSYGNSPTDGSSSFSSKLSLMLIFPLIESQARLDPGLCGITTTILLQSLRECPPLSLREPADCLTGLENLLCRWLGEDSSGIVRLSSSEPSDEIVLPAACLVALACASNSTRTVLHTLYILNQLKTVQHLPVNDIIYILSALEGGPSVPPVLQGARYKTGFWFDDPLPLPSGPPGSEEGRRTIATDGTYLFLTGLTGCGLAKLGSGLNGTFQGFIYSINTDLGQGFISLADGVLLHKSLDQEKQGNCEYLATVINPDTLEVKTELTQSACLQIEAGSAVTINLISNGMEFYWIRAINTNVENGMSSPFAYIIILDVFTVDKNSYAVKVTRPRVVLSKREEPGLKLQGLEHIIRKSKPLRRSSAVDIDPSVSVPQTESSTAASVANLARISANLARVSSSSSSNSSSTSTQPVQVAPGAANSTNPAKDTNSTSLGISYKTLVSTPMLTCGTFITILSPVVNSQSAGAQIARSLLGGGNPGASNRVLATSQCYSTRDGQFSSKHDFSDCINSSLGRGGTLSDFATVFDTVNNCIWGATGDHVDQFSNPGHQAPAFIARKLGFPEESTQAQTKKGNLASTQQIYATLLRHVGLQCSHAVASEKVATSCAGTLDSTLNERTQDLAHFHRVLFLLEAAVSEGDGTSISCLLVSLQAFFNRDRSWAEELEKSRIKQLQELLWSIIDNYEKFSYRISLEACRTLLSAINMVYPSLQVQEELVLSLLNQDTSQLRYLSLQVQKKLVLSLLNQDTSQLRVDLGNMILEWFTQELEAPGTQPNRLRQMLGRMRLNSCIISLLTLSTQKTISLIRTGSIEDVGQLCAGAPQLSPAVKYTATVVNTVLSNCLVDEDGDEDIQDLLRELIQLILDSSSSIIDHLLTEIQEMVSTDSGCLRLKYLNRVLQGSILALVLLPTLTCLTQIVSQGDECEHCNIPVLVGLLTRCCKVSKIYQDNIKKGEPGLEIPKQVDDGILSSVRIPTPWTIGRVLESPHPLKDNYKLKETVQIPGAKLLYIRYLCTALYSVQLILYSKTRKTVENEC